MYRDNIRGGGISVYVGNHIRTHSLNDYCYINDIIEINTVKISLNCNQNINIIAIYRQTSSRCKYTLF